MKSAFSSHIISKIKNIFAYVFVLSKAANIFRVLCKLRQLPNDIATNMVLMLLMMWLTNLLTNNQQITNSLHIFFSFEVLYLTTVIVEYIE